jgi:SAM-dependent methyltransferase
MDEVFEPCASFHTEWEKYSVDEVLTWNRNHPQLRVRDQYIDLYRKKYRKNKKEIRLLDAGSGIGRLLIHYKKKGYSIFGIDNVMSAVKKTKEYDRKTAVIQGDLRDLSFPDETFDIYLSVGVIEHDEEGPDMILQEARRVTKKKGLIIISIPIMNNFYKIFWPLIKFYNIPIIENAIRSFHGKDPIKEKHFHYYLYDKDEFRKAVKRNGFKIIRMLPQMYIPGVARACPLLLNRGKDKDTTGNSPYFLNKTGRFVYRLTKEIKWSLPNCCLIIAERK